jgi:hypothetical protein
MSPPTALRATNGQQLAEAIEVALAFANDGPRLIGAIDLPFDHRSS